MNYREKIKEANRIVFKFGTNVVTTAHGDLSIGTIYSLIESLSELHREGKEIILVSSGAVCMGKKILNLESKPQNVALKQACAAIGQSRLMYFYEEGFDKFAIKTAQLLLTEDDFSNRKKYLNLRNTLNKLLEMKAVPIINQNDVVSTSELETYDEENGIMINFGDNDKLSALVMSKLDADLLVILSDVDGLYTCDPRTNTCAEIINTVEKITPDIESACFKSTSSNGRGGMHTKIEAAKIAVNSSGMAIIAKGKEHKIIERIFSAENIGTLFLPVGQLSSKKRWIAFATTVVGKVIVNKGAKEALMNKNASLLSAGVLEIKNVFKAGDVVSILDESTLEFARGIVNYSSDDARLMIGLQSNQIEKILKHKNYDALITRDNIVLTN